MLLAFAVIRAVRGSPVPAITGTPSPIIALAGTASCDDLGECRTLLSIVWSCLFTILLCTWVSLHPNIPGPEEKWSKVAWRRVGLMTLALLAPEIIVSWAMRQRTVARRLADRHKGLFTERWNCFLVGIDLDCRSRMDRDSWILCSHGRIHGLQW